MKRTGSEDIPRTEDPLVLESGWPDRKITINEKMFLITIAVVALALMVIWIIERGFNKMINPGDSILGSDQGFFRPLGQTNPASLNALDQPWF